MKKTLIIFLIIIFILIIPIIIFFMGTGLLRHLKRLFKSNIIPYNVYNIILFVI